MRSNTKRKVQTRSISVNFRAVLIYQIQLFVARNEHNAKNYDWKILAGYILFSCGLNNHFFAHKRPGPKTYLLYLLTWGMSQEAVFKFFTNSQLNLSMLLFWYLPFCSCFFFLFSNLLFFLLLLSKSEL